MGREEDKEKKRWRVEKKGLGSKVEWAMV